MKIWIQKFAICIDVVVKSKLSNPAKLSCFLFFLRKYSTSKQSIIYGGHLIRIHICALCKCKSQRNPGLKKSANHSKSKIPFDKLGYFSLSVYLSTKCKARRKGGKYRLLQNSCQINGIKAVLKLHFIFSTRKVNCQDRKHFECC